MFIALKSFKTVLTNSSQLIVGLYEVEMENRVRKFIAFLFFLCLNKSFFKAVHFPHIMHPIYTQSFMKNFLISIQSHLSPLILRAATNKGDKMWEKFIYIFLARCSGHTQKSSLSPIHSIFFFQCGMVCAWEAYVYHVRNYGVKTNNFMDFNMLSFYSLSSDDDTTKSGDCTTFESLHFNYSYKQPLYSDR
jgi:hypothetical protein